MKQRDDIMAVVAIVNELIVLTKLKINDDVDGASATLPTNTYDDFYQLIIRNPPTYVAEICKRLKKAVEFARINVLHDRLNDENKQRLTDISSEHSHLWVDTTPTSNEFFLSDHQYRIAAKRRLGIPFFGVEEGERCNLCNTDISSFDERDHYMNCRHSSNTSKYCIGRHNAVAKIITDACRAVDIGVIREPQYHDANSDKRVDFILSFNGRTIYVDVSIINTFAPSYKKLSVEATLNLAASKKQTKHAETATDNEAEFVPFIISTNGALHEQALGLINTIIAAALAAARSMIVV